MTSWLLPMSNGSNISTHTLTWSVTRVFQNQNAACPYFNSHAHVERDGRTSTFKRHLQNFNSHAHVERDAKAESNIIDFNDFNSHAHVERDLQPFRPFRQQNISTHTLTWSVTLDVVYIWCLLNVMRTYFFI